MNNFVEECRREWKRLGVPDPVANEMAEELAADLRQAEAEGVPPEEVLGSGGSDPRAFAGAWSAERGLTHQPRSTKSRFAVAAGAFALLAIAGAVLVIAASPSTSPRPVLATPGTGAVPRPGIVSIAAPPSPAGEDWNLVATDVLVVARTASDDGIDGRLIGWVVLFAGLAGVVLSTLSWLWAQRRTFYAV